MVFDVRARRWQPARVNRGERMEDPERAGTRGRRRWAARHENASNVKGARDSQSLEGGARHRYGPDEAQLARGRELLVLPLLREATDFLKRHILVILANEVGLSASLRL
jgi:hypothetical protein